MSYLLDSHALLWSLFEPDRLGTAARRVITSRRQRVCVSTVSLWEISLKFGIGKLELRGVTPEQLPQAVQQMHLELVELTADEAASFHTLPVTSTRIPSIGCLHGRPFVAACRWSPATRPWLCSAPTACGFSGNPALRRS